MGVWILRYVSCLALSFGLGAIAIAQEEGEEEPYSPGLIVEFSQPKLPPVRRLEAVVSGNWTARPDERLRAGELFTVTYRGLLLVPDDDRYQLHLHGSGEVHVQLAGKPLIKRQAFAGWASSLPTLLTFGPVPVEITFTAQQWPARISLFWSSERFEREPIPARMLAHDREQVIATNFEQGQVLARALRCEACHAGQQETSQSMPAPALDQLAGNLHRDWLVDWLTVKEARHRDRRMPYLPIAIEDAEVLADWLLNGGEQQEPRKQPPVKGEKRSKVEQPSRQAGEQLLLTRGCLACHRVGELGEGGLFGGGDLTQIAAKRPADFFVQWLKDPAQLNRDHRMPVFELSVDDRQSLALALAARGEGLQVRNDRKKVNAARARQIARVQRCDQCHRLPGAADISALPLPPRPKSLSRSSDWSRSCASEAKIVESSQPRFQLEEEAVAALRTYFSQRRPADEHHAEQVTGAQLLIENNCLACHAREPQPPGVLPKKFGDKLVQLAETHEELAPQLASLTPPSLNSIGDKLVDAALIGAITRAGPAHRSYLQVQMPKFRLAKEQADQLAGHFIDLDRIPDYDRTAAPQPTTAQLAARELAGKRLIGTDGFSCTACHQVGSVQPVKAPPNARGPTLSMPQNRLRRTWFDRWVRNPARIVPRMEMPSVQVPVRGVLQDNLHEQLAAVWQVLSMPGFEPPLPSPVRVLRFYTSEDNRDKQPLLVTDLIEQDGQTLERAALIGLPNRQNILFDFAANRLLQWSQGDLARQRTKGKNWYWEPAGSALLNTGLKESELALEIDGEMYEAVADGQWSARHARTSFKAGKLMIEYVLTFRSIKASTQAFTIQVRQTLEPFEDATGRGIRRQLELWWLPVKAAIVWRLANAKLQERIEPIHEVGTVRLQVNRRAMLAVEHEAGKIAYRPEGEIVITPPERKGPRPIPITIRVRYTSHLPPDEYHVPRPPPIPYQQPAVTIAPGFRGERLTLPPDIMPTALAWRPNGELVVASLKGQVLAFPKEALSSPQPQGELLADGLAAPYGIQAGPDFVDVATKFALLRITGSARSSASESSTLAAGWGYTTDYHDWAVGLPKDREGNYYLALPCYQDNRAPAAKRLRGSVLKLTPRQPTMADPELFSKEVLTHGHRFPMGMALNAAGELFVTDNQGNYNPFNELNHLQPGRHFGFVNKGEEKPAEHTAPNIAIPHPWTRSVNGICFLDTPPPMRLTGKQKIFGPLEGQLVGCEYDTRRLIRMSLQKVAGEYQGCCYPLTTTTPPEQAPLGPICCEVSPQGELFIGSIRDSGWGAGNNIGEVIRVKFDSEQLGHGLAEMRATATGFELVFFAPVERELAEQLESYSLSSYRRESTPAYGGNDIDRRTEKVTQVKLSDDRQRVTLAVDALRAGHVYELRLKSLAPAGEIFFPAEAHYTLRQLMK